MTAALNGVSRSSDTPVEVSVGAGTSTATSGTDFATVSDFTVTIAAGTLSQTATFTLEPTDDDADENYFESVAVSGTTTVATFTVTGTAVNIVDDDGRGVTVSDASLTVKEGNSKTYTVVLDSRPTGDVTCDAVENERGCGRDGERCADFYAGQLVERADGDGEGGRRPGWGRRHGGDWPRGQRRRLRISEMVRSVTVTVDDDEFASRGVLLSANIKEVLESAGATTITVTAALNGAPRSSDTPVEVSVGAGWSTATSGTDFATVSDFTVTIAAGTLSQIATFTLEPTDDDVDEGYFESVAVSGTSTVATFSVIGTAVNILDDDDRGVTVSDSSLTVKEGNSETYTVVLDSRPTGDVTVTPSRSSGDADVTVSGALTFTPDNWSSAQAVTVSAAEDRDSNDDTAEIGHAVSGGDYGFGDGAFGDGDRRRRRVRLDGSDPAVGEHQRSPGVRRRHHDHGDGDAERRPALDFDTPVEVSVGAGGARRLRAPTSPRSATSRSRLSPAPCRRPPPSLWTRPTTTWTNAILRRWRCPGPPRWPPSR